MKMTFGVVKSNVPLKQGYLYIKRERNSDRVAARALSKPWQRAYFILYRDPIFFEEYKDASLKSRKHIHLISVIKHVGSIRTSRSKQHAFEIIDDKASLLLACENEILLDEWTKIFIEVMNKRKMQSRIDLEKSPNGIREEYTCTVDIVETTLSGINDLHGEYSAVISSTRMFLLDPEDYGEVLSWPLNHITIHNCQPNQNRILLVMGKNCHFGSGKLILATNEYAQIMAVLNNLRIDRRRVCSTLSSPEVSPTRNVLKPLLNKPKLSLQSGSCDQIFNEEEENIDEIREYQIPVNPKKTSTSSGLDIADGESNIQRLHSCPNLQDSYEDVSDDAPETNEVVVKKLSLKRVSRRIETHFPEVSADGGYIEPNEIPPAERKTSKEKSSRFTPEHTSEVGRPSSIHESEVSTSPYLHILDDDANTSVEQIKRLSDSTLPTDDQVQYLRDTIIEELADPQRHGNETKERKFIPINIAPCSEEKISVNSPTPSCKVKTNREQRRVSEPIKKSVFEIVRNKPKQILHTNSTDQPPSDVRRQSSPGLYPKQSNCSLPKQKSMQPGTIFQNIATKYLIQHKIPFQKVDNIIPGLLPTSNTLPMLCHRKSNNSRTNSRDLESLSVSVAVDQPPPLPLRESPELLQRAQHDLTITIREGTKERSHTLNDLDRSLSTITVNSSRTYTNAPPPLPPKSKQLTLTKSGPSSDTIEESIDDTSRRSSYGEDSWQSADDNNEAENGDGTPPAVPKRNYNTRNSVKQSKIIPCESNLFSINETLSKKHKRPSPLASKPPMSKSLDSLSFVTSTNLPFPAEDETIEASPSPHRRLTEPNPTSKHAIILDGAGKEYPSIAVTKLTENTPEKV